MNPVIIERETTGCTRVKYGPLVVDPRPLVNTDDETKEYVALFNELGPPNVDLSLLTPCWLVSSRDRPYDVFGYYRLDGLTGASFPNFPNFPHSNQAIVDGNGYLYFVAYGWNQPYIWRLYRVRLLANGTPSAASATIDVRSLVPALNAWGNPFTVGIGYYATGGGVAKNDGIVLFAQIAENISEGFPNNGPNAILAVYFTKDLAVDRVEWLPTTGPPTSYLQSSPAGLGSSGVGGIVPLVSSVPPLPDGYFVYTSGSEGVFLAKFVQGAIAASRELDKSLVTGAYSAGPLIWNIWFHDNGSFWSRDFQRTGAPIDLYNSSLERITPAWVNQIAGIDGFFVTRASRESFNFRFITNETSGGSNWYRVRDRDGNIILQKQRSTSFYSGGWDGGQSIRIPGEYGFFSDNNEYSASWPRNIVQTTGRNQFFVGLFDKTQPQFDQWRLHKMSSDSLIGSQELAKLENNQPYPGWERTFMFSRGQWPQLDYSNWSNAA